MASSTYTAVSYVPIRSKCTGCDIWSAFGVEGDDSDAYDEHHSYACESPIFRSPSIPTIR